MCIQGFVWRVWCVCTHVCACMKESYRSHSIHLLLCRYNSEVNCILAFRGWEPSEVGSSRRVSHVPGTRETSEFFCGFLMCFTATATTCLRHNIIIWAKWGQKYGLTVSFVRNGFVCSQVLYQWLSTHLALPPTSSNSKSLLYKNRVCSVWWTVYICI